MDEEEEIYQPLKTWIELNFSKDAGHDGKIKYVEVTSQRHYFKSSEDKFGLAPDISAIDNKKHLIVFECKPPTQPPNLEQLWNYTKGAHHVYAVIDEDTPNLELHQRILRFLEIGLITYKKKAGGEYTFTFLLKSKLFEALYAQSNLKAITIEYEQKPKVIIFPHSRKYFPTKNDLLRLLEEYKTGKDSTYCHKAKRSMPPGSIVLFAYGDEIIGQAVVKINRKATKEEIEEQSKKGYAPKFTFEIFNDLICIFPKPVKLSEIKTFEAYKGKRLFYVIKNYPYLSFEEYADILSKALSNPIKT
jgi:hypothetical protein